ncbi:protein roadkill-like [Rhagoletis pomonella]|uniref:protein roadkill-like n=1 Tax=Rhagoletis pomonella TaxID=28610 RepID=UPI001780F5D8|nr:protein roadkill-like [Rhagoletis pomonella]
MAVSREASQELNTPIAENWCNTQLKADSCNYMWTISNFSLYYEETGDTLISSTFYIGASDKLEWHFELRRKCPVYLSIYLVLSSPDNGLEVRAKFMCSQLNAKGEEFKSMAHPCSRFGKGQKWGIGEFIRRDFLLIESNGLLRDDKLTILCKVSVLSDIVNSSGKSKSIQIKIPKRHLSDDLAALFLNEKFSDVTLAVAGREFRAHKAILAARSAVFSAMFEHEMKEHKQNNVDIQDIDHEVLKEMLCFIYTGKAPNLEQMAEVLLIAADKYALEKLKVICEEAICRNLSVENALEALVLADLHSAHQLKAQAIDFINNNATDVLATSRWQSMITTHSHLFEEVLRKSAKSQIPSTGLASKREIN